jgi:hypothetical protein
MVATTAWRFGLDIWLHLHGVLHGLVRIPKKFVHYDYEVLDRHITCTVCYCTLTEHVNQYYRRIDANPLPVLENNLHFLLHFPQECTQC